MKACNCSGQIPSIKRGDACAIPVHLYFNGAEIGAAQLSMLEQIEFAFAGQPAVCLPAAEVWNETLGCFLLPMTQEQTFALDQGRSTLDVRVRFRGGNVLGARQKEHISIVDANSWEVIQ